MREDLLKKIREEYYKEREAAKKKSIKELNISLSEEGDKCPKTEILDVDEVINRNIVNTLLIKNRKVFEETNEIYFYCSSYHYERSFDEMLKVRRNNFMEDYRRYIDIENFECINVPIDYCEEFEEEHNVVVLQDCNYGYEDFSNARVDFVIDAINNGQEKARSKLLKRTR